MWKRRGLNGTDGLIGRWTKFVQGPRIVIAWRERECSRRVKRGEREIYERKFLFAKCERNFKINWRFYYYIIRGYC